MAAEERCAYGNIECMWLYPSSGACSQKHKARKPSVSIQSSVLIDTFA